MNIKNLSSINTGIVYSWIPHDLKAEDIVIFPDACPGKSPLPTGVAVLTKQTDWRKFTLSDIGCGMLMVKSQIKLNDFNTNDWDLVLNLLRNNKGKLGDLGSGNHFLNAYLSNDNNIYFVIHTGSRLEGKEINSLLDRPKEFTKSFHDTIMWAKENRLAINNILEKVFGNTEFILDTVHNSFEETDNGIIIRKGTVKLQKGDLSIIPSNMEDIMVLVKATKEIDNCLNSISHGTGRIMSRSEAKEFSNSYDYEKLRNTLYIPKEISNNSIKTEAPYCYRNIDDCMTLLDGIVEEIERFIPIAYIGQI